MLTNLLSNRLLMQQRFGCVVDFRDGNSEVRKDDAFFVVEFVIVFEEAEHESLEVHPRVALVFAFCAELHFPAYGKSW